MICRVTHDLNRFGDSFYDRELFSFTPYLPDIMLDLFARYHHFASALHTADPEVHSRAQHEKAAAAAGMGLFHHQFIIDTDIHRNLRRRVVHNSYSYYTIDKRKNQITVLSLNQYIVNLL